MMLDRLSEATRREIEALSAEERRELAVEISKPVDPGAVEFLQRLENDPPLSQGFDVVSLVHEGRPR